MTPLEVAILIASRELKIPKDLLSKVYKAYWLTIKKYIQQLPLKLDLTDDEYNTLRTSINVPSIGKLYSNKERVNGVKKRFKYLLLIKNNDQNKETKTDVY